MRKYYEDILEEIKSNLLKNKTCDVLARIAEMLVATGEEQDGAELIVAVYEHLLEKLATKLGVQTEGINQLWDALVLSEDNGITTTIWSYNEAAVSILTMYHLFHGENTEHFYTLCQDMCTDIYRQKFVDLFTTMTLVPDVYHEYQVKLGALDLQFNFMCGHPKDVNEEVFSAFIDRLYELTAAGRFNEVTELKGLVLLDKELLGQYIRDALDGFEHPERLYGFRPSLTPIPNMGVAGNLAHYAWHSENYPAGVIPRSVTEHGSSGDLSVNPDPSNEDTSVCCPCDDSQPTDPIAEEQTVSRAYSDGQPSELAAYNLEIPKRFALYRVKPAEGSGDYGWLVDVKWSVGWQHSKSAAGVSCGLPHLVTTCFPCLPDNCVDVFDADVLAIPFEGCFTQGNLEGTFHDHTCDEDPTAANPPVVDLSLVSKVLFRMHTATAMRPHFIVCEGGEWKSDRNLEDTPTFMETKVYHDGDTHVYAMMYAGTDADKDRVGEYLQEVQNLAQEILHSCDGSQVRIYNGLNGECLYVSHLS